MARPTRSNWYIAEVVLYFRDDAGTGGIVHVNTILILARSDAEAYDKSLSHGKHHERQYMNPEGHSVTVTFAGLRNLFYVYDDIEDGAELMYEEIAGLSPNQIEALVKPKDELALFAAAPDKTRL
jgi:hypothetical protein